jgi:hypothetical protein
LSRVDGNILTHGSGYFTWPIFLIPEIMAGGGIGQAVSTEAAERVFDRIKK